MAERVKEDEESGVVHGGSQKGLMVFVVLVDHEWDKHEVLGRHKES